MAFAQREASRHSASPVKLFLFKGADATAESLVQSVTLIPGSTEHGYGTTPVFKVTSYTTPVARTRTLPLNQVAGEERTDFEVSLEELLVTFPDLRHVNLAVTWYGDDLRCGECTIRPKIAEAPASNETFTPYEWRVGNVTRASAQVVSQHNGSPAYAGTPSDRSVYEAIVLLRSKGIRVTLYPQIAMDIPASNSLPNPYGGTGQPAYPWRGRITCHPAIGQPGTVDQTSAATGQMNAFFNIPSVTAGAFSWNSGDLHVVYPGSSWAYRHFIFHYATIAAAAGANDLLIGGELVGMTRIRRENGVFTSVNHLRNIANDCRAIVGPDIKISYAADWSEYHSYHDGDDVHFNMDTLWANENVDFIGISYKMPISDWRDGKTHLDWQAGYTSIYDLNYLKANIEGGELYNWRYPGNPARNNQNRTTITDSAHNKPWVFRLKDIRNWWKNDHHNRVAGVENLGSTMWVPQSKPIRFTDLVCPAVEKGTNRPDVAHDPKSSETSWPYFSNARPDAAIQRAHIEAHLSYWRATNEEGFLDLSSSSVGHWDARPYPAFPEFSDHYLDGNRYSRGYWLNGRMVPGRAFESGTFGPYAFCDGDVPITRAGITYQPWPIRHSDLHSAGDLDNADVTIDMALRNDFMSEFSAFPPSQVINVTIFQGHGEDLATLSNYPAIWLGRLGAFEVESSEVKVNCIPVSTSIQRPGLRRNYQLGCPHVLYGPQCRAEKRSITRTVSWHGGDQVLFSSPVTVRIGKYRGGTMEWNDPSTGRREIRTITNTSSDGLRFYIRGTMRGLTNGATVTLTFGCGRTMSDCINVHENILNFGGQPWIPLENPLSQKNQFY